MQHRRRWTLAAAFAVPFVVSLASVIAAPTATAPHTGDPVPAPSASGGTTEPEPCLEAAPPPLPEPVPVSVVDRERLEFAEQLAGGNLQAEALVVGPGGSRRGVADGYLVLPSGGELTSTLRFITTDQPMLGAQPLRFSDLALFELAGRWSIVSRLEASAQVALLAKRPEASRDKPWQSVSAGLHTPLGERSALAISGAGGHLIDHAGMWNQGTAAVEWRNPIDNEWFLFDLTGSADVLRLSAPGSSSALIAELAGSGSILVSAPEFWAAWIGVAYAVPFASRGTDPTSSMAVDPRPRLDLRIGNVYALRCGWDLFAEFAVIDRGDLSAPRTQLPILDGGFDQHQILLGVTRHLEPGKDSRQRRGYH